MTAANVPTPLTTISGGINRLRVKAAADKNSLYDLLNGYVTLSNTVKVRPGSYRNAALDTATKGLVWFDGSFHTFCNEVVDVPSGYTLHVICHPAVNTEITVTGSLTTEVLSGSGLGGPGGFERDGVGLCTVTAEEGAGAAFGSMDPTLFSGGTIGALFECANILYLVMPVGTAQNFFETIELTNSTGSTTNTYSESAATFTTAADALDWGGAYSDCPCWHWTATGDPDFTESNSTAVTFTGLNLQGYEAIAIKEIHFAQPFMGFLYVAAEFEPDTSGLGSIFHYWIQVDDETSAWAANTDYQIGDIVIPVSADTGFFYVASRASAPNPMWTPNTAEEVGNKVEPTVPNGYYFTCISTFGTNPTTSADEPTWPTADGATVEEFSQLTSDQLFTTATAAPQPATNTPNPNTTAKYSLLLGGSST